MTNTKESTKKETETEKRSHTTISVTNKTRDRLNTITPRFSTNNTTINKLIDLYEKSQKKETKA